METIEAGKKKCNFCGETISDELRRCPYCGSLLTVKVDEIKPSEEFHYRTLESNNDEIVENEKIDVEEKTINDISETDNMIAKGTPQNQFENIEETKVQNPNFGNITNFQTPQIAPKQKNALTNGMKVFLTSIAAFVPGIGQLVGIIAAIVFMNSEGDTDRRSFGVSLLIASLILFVLQSCMYCAIISAVFSYTGS